MSALDPVDTTVNDICLQALKECGQIGVGQSPVQEELTDAWTRLQWMLQQWERKRYLVYHLLTYLVNSTGKISYTVGPGGDINTSLSPWNSQFNPQFGGPQSPVRSARPDKIESAFLRQITQSQPNQIDYPLELYQSMEDYNAIALKQLTAFPQVAFYDPAWPLGNLFAWPVPQANIYAVGITIKEQLPVQFLKATDVISLPYEYFGAILYNLALRLRSKYQLPTFPGDPLPGLAADSLAVLRGANTAIAQLRIPADMNRPGLYNIFSDRSY